MYSPDQFGLDYEDAYFNSGDGTSLHGWLMWPQQWDHFQQDRPLVLFYQENAGNMSFRLPFLRSLTRALNCSAFALSYRGYGASSGTPSEAGLREDALAAVLWLSQRSTHPSPLIIMGRSLGGAVALSTAVQCLKSPNKPSTLDLRGLVIENTFSSLSATVGHVMPLLSPFIGPGKLCNFLLRNKWDNIEAARTLKSLPILWMSSLQDEMLPPEHMMELYALHPTEPWELVTFEDGRHIDTYDSHAATYWPHVRDFVTKVCRSRELETEWIDVVKQE